ncbi:MAG: response regulator [Nitrospirae bacterium]|nr:response regulator [Nitrospirota bacterium]
MSKKFKSRRKSRTGQAERTKMEEALLEGEARYRRLIEASTDYIYSVRIKDGRVASTVHGPGCQGVTGYTSDEYDADPYLWYRMIHEEDRSTVIKQSERVLAGEVPQPLEHRIIHKNGSIRWVKNTPVPHHEGNELVAYEGLIVDITERKHLEERLYQSQKMEAIGRLAGGVAHDFNNCLTAIIGFSELSLSDLAPEDPLFHNLEAIHSSALKASGITRQLLAFSRKQMIEPQILSPNSLIADFSRMMKRLLGEDIKLVTDFAPDLGNVKADPSQIEQILMNLSVNARDAMPDGGEMLLRTANVEMDELYALSHFVVTPGEYVMMVVEDTGTGMTEETKAHIFEPFFTTKEKGKGTGLGLATVYGIVKQNGGNIWCYSEEGKGTTFKIYLPRTYEKTQACQVSTAPKTLPRGVETILVVEDEDYIRNATVMTLKQYGYTVIEARHGDEALTICEKWNRSLNLILTDVVMPHLSGWELVERLKDIRNDFKVLYMSGYTNDVISHHGILDKDTNFIAKPFTSYKLLGKIRAVLDR